PPGARRTRQAESEYGCKPCPSETTAYPPSARSCRQPPPDQPRRTRQLLGLALQVHRHAAPATALGGHAARLFKAVAVLARALERVGGDAVRRLRERLALVHGL